MEKQPRLERLSEKQVKQLDVYREKWIKIGLSTKPVSEARTKEIITNFYTKVLLKAPPTEIIIARSPLEAWNIVCEKFDVDKTELVWSYLGGNFDAYLFSMYDYLMEVCGVKIPTKESADAYEAYKATSELSGIYPSDNFCVVSKKCTEIHLKDGKLHRDGGPAVLYEDGFACWSLNGVRVSKEIAETPDSKLDCNLILTTKNVEVGREIVRKIGIERIIDKLGAVTLDEDKERSYTLLRFEKKKVNGEYLVFLKMVNPSLGCYHIEEVESSIKTVREAIHFRKPKTLQDIPIDEERGEEYYQQGDVIIWPKDAKSIKFWPAVLT